MLETLQVERRLTRDTIAAMTDGDVAFKPTAEQMSFGEQALHLIGAQETLLDAFRGKGWSWERDLSLTAYPTLEAILAKFDDMVRDEVAFYGDLDDDDFGRSIGTTWGEPEPVLQLLVSFLAHEAHHRGQMACYLRLKGMKPPQW